MHQLEEVVGKRRQRREEEKLKVDGRREVGRRRGAKKGKIRRGVERRGAGKTPSPALWRQPTGQPRRDSKNSPIPNPQDLIAPTSYNDRTRPSPANEGVAHSALT